MATRRLFAIAAVMLAGMAGFATASDLPTPGEAWRSSPFHGVPNAATGRNIPCVCVYRGREYRLGESICMQTHVGTVITRCDLSLNNTTWAPTTEPCTVSRAPAVMQFACAVPRDASRPRG